MIAYLFSWSIIFFQSAIHIIARVITGERYPSHPVIIGLFGAWYNMLQPLRTDDIDDIYDNYKITNLYLYTA